MSDTKPNDTAGSKSPSHIAYHVRDREGGKGFWTRIGSVWPHQDGKGFNVQLDGLCRSTAASSSAWPRRRRSNSTHRAGLAPARQPERNQTMKIKREQTRSFERALATTVGSRQTRQ